MKKILPKLGIVALVVLMFIPVIIEMMNSAALKNIKYSKLESVVSKTQNFKFALVYVAPGSDKNLDEDTVSIKNTLDAIKEEDDMIASMYGSAGYISSPIGSYYIDYDNLSQDEIKEVYGESEEKYAYLFVANGEILKTVTGKLNEEELAENYRLYSCHGIDEDHSYYKVAKDAASYKKAINKKDAVIMSVFGRDTCYYCNQFKVVYNTLIEEKDVKDIYYFDSDSYDEDEYQKVMDLGLIIPAACNSKGEDVELQQGFSTPLTLFTKNGKVIDCISGYVTKESLETKLKTVGMLK